MILLEFLICCSFCVPDKKFQVRKTYDQFLSYTILNMAIRNVEISQYFENFFIFEQNVSYKSCRFYQGHKNYNIHKIQAN